jgi:hypothetical protein
MNKYLLIFFLFLPIVFFIFLKNNSNKQITKTESQVIEKIKIAVCPTYFEYLQNLDKVRYQVVPTSTTADSLKMLNNGEVDFALGGRIAKPNEPLFIYEALGKGYSFLSAQELTLPSSNFGDYNFFTDLDANELGLLFSIDNLTAVKNVYEYIDQGIVITTWDNTDYLRAQPVHLLASDNKRVLLSRQATIFCKNDCAETVKNDLILFLNN